VEGCFKENGEGGRGSIKGGKGKSERAIKEQQRSYKKFARGKSEAKNELKMS